MKKKNSWETNAEVLDVIDGDTFRCRLDLGWRISIVTTVRVRGVNAPELPTKEGEAAKAFLARVLPAGVVVSILSHRLDKYGRSEADVTMPTGIGLAEKLIASGYVRVMKA